jgi:flagellar hook protein FlgE
MLRSLSSGVSGLTNHQLILDITANNLANVSTSGFKGSRMSFSTALTQTQNGGSAPSTALGGVNPRQVGLGVKNSSVDVDFRQGALLSTGRSMDLAIQGNGFFHMAASDGSNFYTRVGNLGFDSSDNLVDMGSGMMIQGRALDSTGQPSGNVSGVNTTAFKSIDAQATQAVTFQGNLSTTAGALQGSSLSSLLPLVNKTTGAAATESTSLKDLTIFRGNDVSTGIVTTARPVWVSGTKPDGSAYAGTFTVDPWSESVQDLVNKINKVFVQGSATFASAKIENGNLLIQGTGAQKGFSCLVGEKAPVQINSTVGAGRIIDATVTGSGVVNYAGDGSTTSVPNAAGLTIPLNDDALVTPTITLPAGVYAATGSLTLKLVKVSASGNTELLSTTIKGSDLSATAATPITFASMPHLRAGESVAFQVAGTLAVTGMSLTLDCAFDRNASSTATPNLHSDTWNAATGAAAAPGTIGDGIPDAYQENSNVDVNEYVYRANATPVDNVASAETNNFFDWYRVRFVPDKVTSSIQVYDSVGGSHTVEARFFRTGTRSTTNTSGQVERFNGWDMVINMASTEGKLLDGLVTGIEFDANGRYMGNGRLGQTLRGNALSDSNTYSGTPADNTIKVNWASTGTGSISFNLGDAASTTGLTGFGSPSSAAAVSQDGFASGNLDTLSVGGNGNITGLYTNGKSKQLYQLEISVFSNPTGLTSAGGNLWQVSANSGEALSRSAGESGAGSITSGALEGSNVDIASEFTRLITAQRGFQVNARVIQTTDQVLQELAGLIR